MALDAGTAFVTILPKVGAEFTASLSRSLTGPIAAEGKKMSEALGKSLTLGKAAAIGAFAAISAAAVKGLGDAVHATEAFGESVYTLKRGIGGTAEEASKLVVLGEHFGISVDKMAVSFGFFAKQLANGGTQIRRYGIELNNADGSQKPFGQLLGEVADQFVSLPTGIDKAAFAVNVFGRSGRNLLPILALGAKGIAEVEAEASKYGLVLTQGNLEAIHKFALAQNNLTLATQGFQVQIGATLIPVLTTFVQIITEAVVLFGKIPGPIRATILVIAALGAGMVALGLVVGVVTLAMRNLGLAASQEAVQLTLDTAATEANTIAKASLAATLGGSLLRFLPPVAVALAASAANHYVNAEAAKQDAQGHGLFAGVLKVLGFGLPQSISWLLKMQKAHDDAGRAAIADAAGINVAEHAIEAARTATQDLTGQTKLSTDAFYANATAALAARDAQLALSGGLIAIATAARQVVSAHGAVAAAQKAVNADIAKGGKGTQAYRDDLAALRDAQWSSVGAQQGLKQSISSYAQTLMGPLKSAQDAVTSAQADLDKVMGDPKHTVDQATAATENLATAKDALTAAEHGLAPAQQKAIAQMNAMLRQAGFTKAEIAALDAKVIAYADNVKGVPAAASTKFSTPGLAEANAAVQHLANGIIAIQGPHELLFIVKTIGNIPHGAPVSARGSVFRAAAGTMFAGPGGPFIAGEASYPTPLGTGGEVVTNRGVLPLDDGTIAKLGRAIAEAGGSSGGGGRRPIVLSVQIDRREIARAVTTQELWDR